jgi:hypothetical protein
MNRPLIALLCLAWSGLMVADAATNPTEINPQPKTPFLPTSEANREELNKAIQAYMALPPAEVTAHPNAKFFPGAVEAKERVQATVSYDPNLIHRWDTAAGNAPNLATSADVWQETALYAAPGEIVTVKAASLPEGRTVRIIVGCHRDGLLKLDKWSRFPLISRAFTLQAGENKIANAFGGQIFIQVQNGAKRANGAVKAKETASLEFSNAVAAPTFVLGKDNAESWKKSLAQAPAPWVTLVAKNAILHVRRFEVAQLENPQALLEWWDKALGLEDDLVALHRLAPERVVPDIQISAGFMHSGYPFMCWVKPSEHEIVDLAKLTKEGNWGFFHELGHNHQRTDWTFSGQTEVTCNLFSLYCMEKLVGKPTGEGHGGLKNISELMTKRTANPPTLGPWEQLAPFIVLIKAHGWEPLRTTLRSYEKTPAPKGSNAAALQNVFVLRYGQFAKANVSNFFTSLGYPVSEETQKALKDFPVFNYAPTK